MVASDVEPVHLNLIDQRGARNAELQGGPRTVAAVEFEGLLDVPALHIRKRLRLGAPVPAPLAQIRRQRLPAALRRAARRSRRPLHHIGRLAHVPGPRWADQAGPRLRALTRDRW